MFLSKKEDIDLLNQILASNDNLDPYLTELHLACYLMNKEKYLSILELEKLGE
jgi:uncharacterized protein with HEPN domain